RIVDLAQLRGDERIVEIGPGLGALSRLLAQRARELWLIEVDADLARHLSADFADRPHVHVVTQDVLSVDFGELLGSGAPAVLVANLPANIATAVLTALLAQPGRFSRMVLMLQREVVNRLRARPGGKEYGVLSVFTQLTAHLQRGMRVAPEAFVPRPRVESEVIVVEPRKTPAVAVRDQAAFNRLVRTVFAQRRNQRRNSLRPLCSDAIAVLSRAGIAPPRRPETLTLEEFAALSDALHSAQSTVRLQGNPKT